MLNIKQLKIHDDDSSAEKIWHQPVPEIILSFISWTHCDTVGTSVEIFKPFGTVREGTVDIATLHYHRGIDTPVHSEYYQRKAIMSWGRAFSTRSVASWLLLRTLNAGVDERDMGGQHEEVS